MCVAKREQLIHWICNPMTLTKRAKWNHEGASETKQKEEKKNDMKLNSRMDCSLFVVYSHYTVTVRDEWTHSVP